MQTSFVIEKSAKDPNDILKSFAASNKNIIEFTKKEDVTCKGGQNRVNPEYVVQDKNQRVFNGYRGSVSYVCTFDKIQSYNALLNASFESGQRLNLSPVQWIATDLKKKEAEKLAEKKLVNEARDAVIEYSLSLDASCSLKSLEVISNSPHPQYMMAYAKSERVGSGASIENFQPTQDDIVLQLSGNIELSCIKK